MTDNKEEITKEEITKEDPIVWQMTISVTEKGRVLIEGIPNNYESGRDMMIAAMASVQDHYINHAKAGRMNDRNLITLPHIIG